MCVYVCAEMYAELSHIDIYIENIFLNIINLILFSILLIISINAYQLLYHYCFIYLIYIQ